MFSDVVFISAVQGDIRDSKVVKEAVAQSRADVIFHIASYGMSGREQVRRMGKLV